MADDYIYIEKEDELEAQSEFQRIYDLADERDQSRLVMVRSYSQDEGNPVWVICNYGRVKLDYEKSYSPPNFFMWKCFVLNSAPPELQSFLEEKSYFTVDGSASAIVGVTSVIAVPALYWECNFLFNKKVSYQRFYQWLQTNFPQHSLPDLKKWIRISPRRLANWVSVKDMRERVMATSGRIVKVN